MQFSYLVFLIVSIVCLAVIDWRYTLAYWFDRKRTLLTLGIAVSIFIIWDLLGIGLGIFFHGKSDYALPLRIAPEFPVEELFFLVLLCYSTLIIYRGASKLWRRI